MLHECGWIFRVCVVLVFIVVIGTVASCNTIYGTSLFFASFHVDELQSLTVENESSTPIEVVLYIPSRLNSFTSEPSKEAYRGYLAAGESWVWKKDDGPLYKFGTMDKPMGLRVRYRSVFKADDWREVQFEREDHIAVVFSDGDDGIDVIAETRDGRWLKMFDPGEGVKGGDKGRVWGG